MKAVSIADLPKLLRQDLDMEINTEEKYLDVSLVSQWGGDSKEEYEKSEELIREYRASGKGWNIIAWHDVSGYDYWMLKQQEPNYIQLTVNLDSDTIEESEISKLNEALYSASLFFEENIQSFY